MKDGENSDVCYSRLIWLFFGDSVPVAAYLKLRVITTGTHPRLDLVTVLGDHVALQFHFGRLLRHFLARSKTIHLSSKHRKDKGAGDTQVVGKHEPAILRFTHCQLEYSCCDLPS